MQGLPADSYGSNSAVTQAIRNLGATLGVAIVVAFTGDLAASTAIDAFRHVWWGLVATGVCVSALSLVLPDRRAAVTRAGSRAPTAEAAS